MPRSLETLIERCTAKDAGHRPAGLGEVCAELQRILETAPSKITPPKVAASALPKLIQRLPRILRTNTGLILLASTGVVLVMILLFGLLKLTRAI